MINSAAKIAALVDSQVKTIADPIVRSSLQSLLIPPIKQKREWFYGGDSKMLSCWIIMEYKQSDAGIAYSDFGYGPSHPWGSVFLSERFMGDKSGWFQTLEEAFYMSYAGFDLQVWNIVKKVKGETVEIIERNLTLHEAYKKRDQLKLDPSIYDVDYKISTSNP